ncbi:MAG: cobalamin biosynthesis protein CobD [Syntrophomonadaceae bacterium]|nr:cobalamin biosynthesis protein CobD [Syntrophomonadaceae bacterium]
MEYIITAALLLDLIIGDPRWIPHPVTIIGKFITLGEGLARKTADNQEKLKICGAILAFLAITGTYLAFWGLIRAADYINGYFGLILSVFFMSQAIAVKSLYQHANAVAKPLLAGDLTNARISLSMIVGRDTDHLSEREMVRGTVETVAENTVDGIIAPLFYGFIGGPPLAMAYKAINTLDSMLGYKNDKYLYLGWASARIDDLANYLPARITGLLFLFVSLFSPGGVKSTWNTIKTYAPLHPSPNSGIPEAAVAGLLKIQLGGSNYYGGIVSNRPLIGERQNELQIKHIYHSLYLMLAVTWSAWFPGFIITVFVT